MKNSVLLLMLVLLLQSCKTVLPIKEITNAELTSIVQNNETTLVDVRIPEQYVAGTAKGAINIPLAEVAKNAELLRSKENVILFCNTGRQSGEALELLRKKGLGNVYSAKTLQNIQAILNQNAMNNIHKNLTFSNDKPSVYSIKKSDKLKYFAVGLGAGAVLKKHTAPVPSTLVVLKGEIEFHINNEVHHFRALDVYDIPVEVEHEVVGVGEENIFTVSQEL